MYNSCKNIVFILTLGIGIAFAIADGPGFTSLFLDNIESQYGAKAKSRLISWQKLIQDNAQESEWHKINAVNDFFNQMRFVSDQKHWNRKDYWATPVEFLSTYGGDCEDFSIAKYFTLIELGVPDERLRITYVKAVLLNQAHMVLAYYEEAESEPLILDNLDREIRSASWRDDLTPVYSFNGEGLWFAKERGQGRRVEGGSKRINLWRDMNVRMDSERERGISYTAKNMAK